MTTSLLKTPLYDIHHSAGAKIVPFAGYEMPVSYAGIKQEHLAVRQKVGMFDVSHMGNFEVSGSGAQAYLEFLTSNGVHKLAVGDVQYSTLCNEAGNMVDDILVYRYGETRYQVIVNASNKAADWGEFQTELPSEGVELINKSDDLGIIAVQGPLAEKLCQKVFPEVDLSQMKFYSCASTQWKNQELLFSRTGYTGEDGFEFYPTHGLIKELWAALFEAGAEFGVELCGLGCRDTLRLEAGYSLYGHELNLDVHPLDSGLAWICDLDTEFKGKAEMVRRKNLPEATTIIGLELVDKGIPREGYEVTLNGEAIGQVTSGSISPLTSQAIAMARVTKGKVKIGDTIEVIIRNKPKQAQVVSRRFYTRD